MPGWLSIVLTVALNVAMAIVNFGFFADNTLEWRIASAVAWVLSNLLALFGQQVVPPPGSRSSGPRNQSNAGPLIILVAGALGMALAAGGCATARDVAVGTKHAISESLAKAAVEFSTYDRAHQLELVRAARDREAAVSAIAEWQSGPQAQIQKAFHGVVAALEGIDVVLRATAAGLRGDPAAATRALLDAAQALGSAIEMQRIPVQFTAPSRIGGGK